MEMFYGKKKKKKINKKLPQKKKPSLF